jgi:hypothetical protein
MLSLALTRTNLQCRIGLALSLTLTLTFTLTFDLDLYPYRHLLYAYLDPYSFLLYIIIMHRTKGGVTPHLSTLVIDK